MADFATIKIDKKYFDMLKEMKMQTRIPMSAYVEEALKEKYGEPKKKQSKK